jgi:hypothetical protein
MSHFVWIRVGANAGQDIQTIAARKEAERKAGGGEFWWGVGSSLGPSVRVVVEEEGPIPVVFSHMLTDPQPKDASPSEVLLWTSWVDHLGSLHEIPEHVIITSSNHPRPKHYAMVCRSEEPFALVGKKPFNPKQCRTINGKAPGSTQFVALLEPFAPHLRGPYTVAFQAVLAEPYFAELRDPRAISPEERSLLDNWPRSGTSWINLARQLRP